MTQNKKIALITGAIGFLWVIAQTAPLDAAGIVPKSRFDQGAQMCRDLTFSSSSWASEGAEIFRNSCKECHSRDSGKGAPFLHSESRTTRAWSRVFFEKYPKCAQDGAWAKLSSEQLMKVNDYLYRNAYGTYDPNSDESCG
jgi:hypothetical protein